MLAVRALSILAIGLGILVAAPIVQAAQLAQGGQQTPAPLPQNIINSITATGCDSAKLDAAVKQAAADNQTIAADIAAFAVGQCPNDAAGVAGAAASAAPTQVGAILVAVIEALPPTQQQNDAPGIIAALLDAVPEAGDQITAAIGQLAFSAGQDNGFGNRSNIGAPLVAPHTDVPSSPTTPL